jgi:hypothetical protein
VRFPGHEPRAQGAPAQSWRKAPKFPQRVQGSPKESLEPHEEARRLPKIHKNNKKSSADPRSLEVDEKVWSYNASRPPEVVFRAHETTFSVILANPGFRFGIWHPGFFRATLILSV